MRTTEIYDDTAIIAVRVVRFRDNTDHNLSLQALCFLFAAGKNHKCRLSSPKRSK